MAENIEVETDPLESIDNKVIRAELRELIIHYYSTLDGTEFITDAALGFKREHPDSYDYVLFHDLIGSTPPPWVEKFDMPNHEIETFIRDLSTNLNASQQRTRAA